MKFTALYSGSKGNSYLVQSKESTILVDCGFTLPYLDSVLSSLRLTVQNIDAVFVTHEHYDHINALPQINTFCKHTQIFAHELGAKAVCDKIFSSYIRTIPDSITFRDLAVDTIRCSHDSEYCCGYRFYDGKSAVGLISDTGVVPNGAAEFLSQCNTVLLESNHDEALLLNGDYPYVLKRRILSEKGHLSNAQCRKLLSEIIKKSTVLKNVVLGHLSQNNNLPELAFSEVAEAFKENGLAEGRDVKLLIASQSKRSASVE